MPRLPLRAATLLAAVLASGVVASAQPLERVSPPATDTTGLPSPSGALFRSLAVPGWGQVYNRQAWKVPIVVGGLGTLVGVTVFSHGRADLFRRAALFADCTADPPAVSPDLCTGLDPEAFARADGLTAGPLSAGSARTLRDGYRRQRDLFVLFSVLAYGLQALDAYVAAQLADFDVGEDLSVGVTATPEGPALALRVRF
jgi:hypothetical protein